MTAGILKNWVWCEDCLEWKDAGEEDLEEFPKMLLVKMMKLDKLNKNIVIPSVTRPRGQ